MLKIRRASIEDTPTVLNLVPRLIDFSPPEWRDPEEMSRADFEVIETALQSTNDDPAIYIAELDGGLAGFIHLHSVVDYYRQRPHASVADLVVHPAAAGPGVATPLRSATGFLGGSGVSRLCGSILRK